MDRRVVRELRASAAGKNNEARVHGCYLSFLAQTVKEYGYHDVTDQMEKIFSHLICVTLVGSYFKIEDSFNRIMTFCTILNSDKNVQASDTTKGDSSKFAGYIIII